MACQFADCELDLGRFELRRGGSAVAIERRILLLLTHLVQNRHRLVTRDELAQAIWPGRVATDASIASGVRAARQAIGDDGVAQELIRTVHGQGFRFVAQVREIVAACPLADVGRDDEGSAMPSRPSIAVLRFRQPTPARGLGILNQALPHEIIQALSRLRWLAVIDRASSFRVSRAPSSRRDATDALGVNYLLTGLIESGNRRLAVHTELIDARSDTVVWGDRLQAPIDEVDDLRRRITAHIIASIDWQIPLHEARIHAITPLEHLDAWANYHHGVSRLFGFTPEANRTARHCFERAIALDPVFARAHAGLSFTSFVDAFLHLVPDTRRAADEARRHAVRGLELDPLDPFVNFTMGRSLWLTDELEPAALWLQRALDLNPNYAQAFYSRALTAMLAGDVQEVPGRLDMALQLSPLDPMLYAMHAVRAMTLIQSRDHAQAALWADRAAASPGAHHIIAMIAALANGLARRPEQAERWRHQVRITRSEACVRHFFDALPIRNIGARTVMQAELARQGF